jgi:hypothetical protein
MAKGQMKSSREAKKPKKAALEKAKPATGGGAIAAPPMPVPSKQKNG